MQHTSHVNSPGQARGIAVPSNLQATGTAGVTVSKKRHALAVRACCMSYQGELACLSFTARTRDIRVAARIQPK